MRNRAKLVASSPGLSRRSRSGWHSGRFIGMAGTSPAMTKWGCHEFAPATIPLRKSLRRQGNPFLSNATKTTAFGRAWQDLGSFLEDFRRGSSPDRRVGRIPDREDAEKGISVSGGYHDLGRTRHNWISLPPHHIGVCTAGSRRQRRVAKYRWLSPIPRNSHPAPAGDQPASDHRRDHRAQRACLLHGGNQPRRATGIDLRYLCGCTRWLAGSGPW
jgi:hypothetical protein